MTTGIQPVQSFEIETLYDKYDPRLTEFRKNILLEVSSDSVDFYKYSDYKWKNTDFFCIEAIIENNEIVGMSGCKWYNDYLRTSMHLYLLKKVRSKYPGIKYLKGGWFERHLNMAKNMGAKGMFFTVYAYSKKLQALIENHRSRTISLVDKKHLNYIKDIFEKGEYIFNGVPQTFFYYSIESTLEEFDPNEFERVVPNR